MTTRSATASVIAALLAGCGTDPVAGEPVVDEAGPATLLGVSESAVFWTVPAGAGARVLGGSLAALPTEPHELAMATGPVVQAADHVVLATGDYLMRVGMDASLMRVVSSPAEALGETPDADPSLVWSIADRLSWGKSIADRTVVLPRTTRVDHVRISPQRIYAAVDGPQDRRLVYVDRADGLVHNLTSSDSFATAFPGGAGDGATYRGRIVGADDTGVFWLVEESPSGRAVLIALPERGTPAVLLENMRGVGAVFVTDDALYWQEGDALLTAPRAGGTASIAAHLPGPAGAVADGFVYYVNGSAIERLAL